MSDEQTGRLHRRAPVRRVVRWLPRVVVLAAAMGATSVIVAAVAVPTMVDSGASASDAAVRVDFDAVFDQPGTADAPAPPASTHLVDTSDPDIVIGSGTPAGCTSAAVVDAVARGGVITFDCGPAPISIAMSSTAKVVNTSPEVVIDGGELVTLDGLGQRRILYMNTCDRAQIWTTPTCQNQDHPRLTIQRIDFVRGDSTGEIVDGGGGGAVFVRGGTVKVLDSNFIANRCEPVGPDVGGGAIRVLSQFNGTPVIVARSVFFDNECSNGGATSSIGVSWRMYNSTFVNNRAIGNGANPQRAGTPGGGNGGAIYLDGNEMSLELVGTSVRNNVANEGGGAVFFVSNNRAGRAAIDASELLDNPSRGFETPGFPGIFHLGSGPPLVTNSTLS